MTILELIKQQIPVESRGDFEINVIGKDSWNFKIEEMEKVISILRKHHVQEKIVFLVNGMNGLFVHFDKYLLFHHEHYKDGTLANPSHLKALEELSNNFELTFGDLDETKCVAYSLKDGKVTDSWEYDDGAC